MVKDLALYKPAFTGANRQKPSRVIKSLMGILTITSAKRNRSQSAFEAKVLGIVPKNADQGGAQTRRMKETTEAKNHPKVGEEK